MQHLEPITWTPRPLRLIWHLSAVLVAALALFATTADAGPRRARLSSDLSAHLTSGSGADVDVIVSGSVEKIARLAQRHRLRLKRQLESGAVFTVSKQSLDALSQDLEVEALSGNARVRSASALTTDIVGADAAWAGRDRGARCGQRPRHWRGDHRQRHRRRAPGVAEPRDRQRGFRRSGAGQGLRLLRPWHPHRRHRRGPPVQAAGGGRGFGRWRRRRT